MSQAYKRTLISVVGPTAIGKTKMAMELAQVLDTEIISADSRQFYRELVIGTAKPSREELDAVPHHFIDSHSIKSLYSAGEYGRDAVGKLSGLFAEKDSMIAVGGSGLYLKALWEGFDEMPVVAPSFRKALNQELKEQGLDRLLEELRDYDPEYYLQVDQKNGQRIVRALEIIRGTGEKYSHFRQSKKQDLFYHNFKIGLTMERADLFERIDTRMDFMIANGLFEEAQKLYVYKDHNALKTVGYSEIFDFIDDKQDKEETIRLLKRNSRRYAKRQLTWFRKYDDIHWYTPSQRNEIVEEIKSKICS